MFLVDPRPDQFEGQIVYLDFDGAEDVTYNGPVVVENIDVAPFAAPGELAGREQEVIADVVAQLEETFEGTGVSFTIEQPDLGNAYSTVFVGGDNTAFSEYGDFFGLSETVDIGNQNKTDEAFVFTAEFAPFGSSVTAANALVHTIEHEAGHLLGFTHESASPETLEDFAYTYSGTVYWGVRYLDWSDYGFGWIPNQINHHFMVISFSGSAAPSWPELVTLGSGDKAIVVGGFKSEVTGKLTTDYGDYANGDADLEATNDWLEGGLALLDWGPIMHEVSPPSGHDFDSFSTTLYELTQAYDNTIDFALGLVGTYAQNCATYVNTMMAKAGVPEDVRIEKGEFLGVDWGEENILYSGHFSPLRPSGTLPANAATDVSLTPTLQSSAFSDPDSGDTHKQSLWEVATDNSFSNLVWQHSDTDSNKTSEAIPSGKLDYDTWYYWRVRHRDNRDDWSRASSSKYFKTEPEPDTTRPTATVQSTDSADYGETSFEFTMSYADNVAVDSSDIGTGDVAVTGPGFNQTATYVSKSTSSDTSPITATYRITPPGGSWNAADNETYTISMQSNQVSDTSDNYVTSGSKGTFVVNVTGPDTTRPTATVQSTDSADYGETTFEFTMSYADNVAVDSSDIGTGDVVVTSPGFSQTATYVEKSTSSDTSPITATYRITPPGGSWDAADNETYTISMQSNQVSDTSDNYVTSGSKGTFDVSVSNPTGEIRGIKWNDLDGNGEQDPGELGLQGWSRGRQTCSFLVN